MNGPPASVSSRDDHALREALLLPFCFLTVGLAGGFRADLEGTGMRFLVPPLFSLVLSMLLVGTLHRSGVLEGERLMNARRSAIENVSGVVVLVALFAATAQLLNLLTPEAGLLRFLINIFFLVLLWTMMAAEPDARRLLRSLLVVFSSVFVLKYVLFASLSDPEGGLTTRVLTTLLEGATLGTLAYETQSAVTGYVAFFTILLYMGGLLLLPRSRPAGRRPALPPSDDPPDGLLPDRDPRPSRPPL